MSDDGASALVVIALLGSPFSPAYAKARAGGKRPDPLAFSAFNVSLTHSRASRWALTERGASAIQRDASSLAIGRSSMRWEGDRLVMTVNEQDSPWGRPLRGRIVFHPELATEHAVAIDGAGDHLWWPVAPFGRAEVCFDEPALWFKGSGYLDANAGSTPLEEAFTSWSWSRLSRHTKNVQIAYDVQTRAGARIEHGLVLDANGMRAHEGGDNTAFGSTRFGLRRSIRAPAGASPRLVRTIEDGPFYARSLVEVPGTGQRGMHEVVSLDRFASKWVQFLIPFRMRRSAA